MSRELKFRAWDKKRSVYEDTLCVYIGPTETNDYIIEQFTGLKDRNGKEIYEGDVVKRVEEGGFDTVGVVEWSERAARFWVDGYYYPNGKNWEVIGNIHENKELLGGEE